MKGKNQESDVFTIQKDPVTGQEVMVPDPTARSIKYSTEDLKKWVEKGLIPGELGKYALAEIEKTMEELTYTKKMKESGATKEEFLEWFKNRTLDFPGDFKKKTDLIDFLLKNKDKLLGIIAAFEEKKFRQSREIIDNKLNGKQSNDADKNNLSNQENMVEPIIKGLDFSPAEDKLMQTISLLLSRKSERYDQSSPNYYMGNYEKGMITIESIDMETARMVITPHELYSTYLGHDKYGADQIRFILDVLGNLAKRNFLITLNIPSKTSKQSEEKKFNKMRTYLPAFQVVILNPDLTVSQSQEIDKNGLLIEGKKCSFLFKFSPLFTNNIRDRYVEFPEDIHLRISKSKASGAKGRIPQCVNLMRDLLFREKQQKRYLISRDEETLVKTLGLSKEWEAGKKGRVQDRLKKSFEVFKEIGLIESVKKMTGSRGQFKYEIEINKNFK